MCDESTLADALERERTDGGITRRQFGVLSAATGLSIVLSDDAHAAEVQGDDVLIETPDGKTDAYFVHPKAGTHPGVILWPDIFGLRPAMRQMATRLAESGYAVLVVNPYYRLGTASIVPEGADFEDEATRNTLMSLMGSLTPETQATDATAFVDFLDAQPSVARDRKMGTMGYCMGGPITMRTAAARPDRVGAGASFHGGGLASDSPSSPHLLVPKMNAHFLFAIAENDDEGDPKAKDLLREAFAKGELPAEIEVYAGALHGWCPPDSRVYNEAQAERAWGRLLALFAKALA